MAETKPETLSVEELAKIEARAESWCKRVYVAGNPFVSRDEPRVSLLPEDYAALKNAASKRIEADDWQPIETAPKDWVGIIYARFDHLGNFGWAGSGKQNRFGATHWMHASPPQEQVEPSEKTDAEGRQSNADHADRVARNGSAGNVSAILNALRNPWGLDDGVERGRSANWECELRAEAADLIEAIWLMVVSPPDRVIPCIVCEGEKSKSCPPNRCEPCDHCNGTGIEPRPWPAEPSGEREDGAELVRRFNEWTPSITSSPSPSVEAREDKKISIRDCKEDGRPQKGGWAPGDYMCQCRRCGCGFIGDKRAVSCADCAYAPVEPSPSSSVEGLDEWKVGEPNLSDLIDDLEKASSEAPPPVFDKWLYKKAAEALERLEQERDDYKQAAQVEAGEVDRRGAENERLREAMKAFVRADDHAGYLVTGVQALIAFVNVKDISAAIDADPDGFVDHMRGVNNAIHEYQKRSVRARAALSPTQSSEGA